MSDNITGYTVVFFIFGLILFQTIWFGVDDILVNFGNRRIYSATVLAYEKTIFGLGDDLSTDKKAIKISYEYFSADEGKTFTDQCYAWKKLPLKSNVCHSSFWGREFSVLEGGHSSPFGKWIYFSFIVLAYGIGKGVLKKVKLKKK